MLDYLSKSNKIKVSLREGGRTLRIREGDVKMEVVSQGMWEAARRCKWLARDFPLASPEGMELCQYLDLSHVKTISDF